MKDKSKKNKLNKKTKKYSYKKKKGGKQYPGTSIKRLNIIHNNIRLLTLNDLKDTWNNIRPKLLNAGGLKNVYETSHIFNDFNHCDLTPMKRNTFDNQNQGKVMNIHPTNYLGDVIKKCSINNDNIFKDNDGSWGTCMIGCNQNPPQDVAHIQFKSKIAFKLIWLPPNYDEFVLVDDDGNILKKGINLDTKNPNKIERKKNFETAYSNISKYTRNLII